MDEIAKIILSAKRRKFLRSRAVFMRLTPVSEVELFRLATGLNFKFVTGLARWLLIAGYGEIDETLSFREDLFRIITEEPMDGHVVFAQDSDGNRFAFNPRDGSIHCIPKSALPSRMSDDFPSFMRELIQRDYRVREWVANLSTAR